MSYHSANKAQVQDAEVYRSNYANTGPQPSQPAKASKTRKKADPDAPKPEKRGAIFKKSCPKNILDRVERVMLQRFFMIDRQRVEGELKETFSVLGSTGNVYTVKIDHRPSCNCPDAMKGNHCKHILFIFLKVLQVTQASGLWYQKALLTSELETVFAEAPLAPNSVAHPRIREAHARATGKQSDTACQSPTKKRVPGPEDDCPICYDGMHGVNETSLVFCEDCGNALHKECFKEWKDRRAKDHKDLTCVWCRARWVYAPIGGANTTAGGARIAEGYLNLSGVSGLSPIIMALEEENDTTAIKTISIEALTGLGDPLEPLPTINKSSTSYRYRTDFTSSDLSSISYSCMYLMCDIYYIL
ncbi:hypothetical protein H0H81_005460 [Sphagnurus paluster]|uniref:Uncharacterized protein n=1 Tax=Sphagnurus paluster TaxID=117069 RepID=A0A9P7GN53_9AGAR|nr:hypothetical protein H0H81_005460 [Sphagnurus paluster]